MRRLYVATLDLWIEKDGYIPFRDLQFAVPEDGSTVRIQLEPGNEVRVTVEDDRGGPLDANVFALLASGAQPYAAKQQKGIYVLRGLPDSEVTLQAFVGDEEYEWSHQGSDPEARLEVPSARGHVMATVWLPDDLYVADRTYLWLLPDDESGHVRWGAIDPKASPGTTVEISGVLPGDYDAVVRRYVSGVNEGAVHDDVTGHVAVTVEVGRTAVVQVRPR